MDAAFRGLSVSRFQYEYGFLADRYSGSVAPGKTWHDGSVVDFSHDYCPACRTSCEHSLSCSLAGLLNMEQAIGPCAPRSSEQSAILVVLNSLPVFLYHSRQGNSSPSRRTYHRSRRPSPLDVSFPAVADKLDNFCATYSYLSFR